MFKNGRKKHVFKSLVPKKSPKPVEGRKRKPPKPLYINDFDDFAYGRSDGT